MEVNERGEIRLFWDGLLMWWEPDGSEGEDHLQKASARLAATEARVADGNQPVHLDLLSNPVCCLVLKTERGEWLINQTVTTAVTRGTSLLLFGRE